MKDLIIPIESGPFEQVIKKSRFIAFVGHAANREAALAFVQHLRQRYPDARHVCWAFVAGEPGNTTEVGCSDDGEPSGTAGKPMLNVLLQSSISEVVVVVVRYFGGIKLGAGGLLRAYSGAVADAIKQTPVTNRIAMLPFTVQADYALEDRIRRTLHHYNAQIEHVGYADQLLLTGVIPATEHQALTTALVGSCAGQVTINLPKPA